MDEGERVTRLRAAQASAEQLFAEVEARRLIAPGVTERAASDAVRDLAAELFGTARFWHKRVVRAGPNTLLPYRHNPPDRLIGDDDIAFVDLGPLFGEWEADVGRTYVLGDDPVKHRLAADLPRLFAQGRDHVAAHPEITGAQLYDHVAGLARAAGWEFGNEHCGHLVGEFPHEKIDGQELRSYLAPGNDEPLRRLDAQGRVCHWILEIHLVDRERGFGGFYEQLVDT